MTATEDVIPFPTQAPPAELTPADVAELVIVVTTWLESKGLPAPCEAPDLHQALRQLCVWAEAQG